MQKKATLVCQVVVFFLHFYIMKNKYSEKNRKLTKGFNPSLFGNERYYNEIREPNQEGMRVEIISHIKKCAAEYDTFLG